jgi:hypothetical protein
MKKLALVLVLVFVFALPVLANPFVDVPLNHWAYDSVQSLAAKGVVVGYPDGTFGGGKSLTRYEFAEATAKALAYVEGMDFASAEDVAILEKLAIEFADELASLGVTVADLEAALGANTEAIAALEATVAKLDSFFEPLKVTGEFRVRYNKGVVPMAAATLQDRTRLWFEAEINDNTKAGIRFQATDTLGGAGTPAYTWSAFWVDYQGDNLSIYVGEILPDVIGLGLISYYEEDLEFDGFTATWTWDEEDTDLGTWTMFGDVEDYYVLHVAAALGDEDEVALGVTASYDVLAGNAFIGGADVAFALGEDDEVSVAVEVAGFYDTALSYAGAAKISGSMDDLGLTVKAWYVLPGFAPTMTDFTADRLGGYLEAKYPLTDEVTGKARVTYEMDSAMVAAVTTKVRGTLNYVPEDAAEDEAGEVYVEYNVLAATTKARAKYMNYPLADDFVLNLLGQYTYPTADYAGAVTLVYALADDKDLIVEARADSDGAAPWSAEAKLAYALDTNTTLSVGFEMNDWEDDINDYDELNILDTLGTLKAELKVKF